MKLKLMEINEIKMNAYNRDNVLLFIKTLSKPVLHEEMHKIDKTLYHVIVEC